MLREDRAPLTGTQPVQVIDTTGVETKTANAQPVPEVKPAPAPEAKAAPVTEAKPAPAPEKELPPFRVIGVAFKTYILVEAGDTLMLIDQHAAHERLQYEKYMARAQAGAASQQLLSPLILHLSGKEMAVIEDNLETLSDAGYTVEPFGETDIRVTAVPFVMGKAEVRPLFLEMLQSLSQLKAATIDARRAEIMQMACKSAVKAGDSLTDSEIAALIRDMLETGAPPTCPHGRPVVKTLNRRELEKMFRRIQ